MRGLFIAVTTLVAAPLVTGSVSSRIIPGAYVLKLNDGVDLKAFEQGMRAVGEVSILRYFDYQPFRGFSFQLDDAAKAREVAGLAGVNRSWPLEALSVEAALSPRARRPRARLPDKGQGQGRRARGQRANQTSDAYREAYMPHVMTQVDRLHKAGFTGKGYKIAMLDTGVDYTHPDLGGCFGPGCAISFGADLVHGEATPRDCGDHGTPAAGVIIARSNRMGFRGAAPGVELGMYRVSCGPDSYSDTMIDGILRAFEEGAHIISSSVGFRVGWSTRLVSYVAAWVAAWDVVFVQAVGNEAAGALFGPVEPAAAHGVISVGCVDGALRRRVAAEARYAVGAGPPVSVPVWPADGAAAFTGAPMPLYAPPAGHDSCRPLPAGAPDLRDAILLLRLGDCGEASSPSSSSSSSSSDGIDASRGMQGARRVLVYGPPGRGDAEARLAFPARAEGVVAVAMLTARDAAPLLEALRAGRGVMFTAFPPGASPPMLLEAPNERTAGAVSPYSSWGPSWDLAVVPSLTAVGEGIVSTSETSYGLYDIYGGTSYATPLVAAIVALVAEARGGLYPTTMKSLLVAHSTPQRYNDREGFYPFLAPVAQQGGGLIRAYDAAFATTLVDKSSLNFKDTAVGPEHLQFTIRNLGKTDVEYRLSHVPAVTVYTLTESGLPAAYPASVETIVAAATINLSHETLTIASLQSATIQVRAFEPPGLEYERLALWSGWIAINGSDGSSLSLPYQGISGSMHEHRVLPPNGVSLFYGGEPVEEFQTVTLPPQDANRNDSAATRPLLDTSRAASAVTSPLVLEVIAAFGTPFLCVDVVPLSSSDDYTGTNLSQMLYFPQELMELGKHQFAWDGRLDSGSYAPAGVYKLVVRALRVFGNRDVDGDWDIVKTPYFRIMYEYTRESQEAVARHMAPSTRKRVGGPRNNSTRIKE